MIAERDDHGKPYLPAYYRSRIYIDLSDESERVSNFEKLIRWVFDKPMYTRPALGTPPSYVTEENATIQLHTSTHARRAIDALRNVKPFWKPALDEYLDALTAGLDLLRYPVDPDYPIVVLQCIDKFRPHRDEFIGVIAVASRYVVTLEISDSLRRFFEKSACYLYRQQGRMQWNENEFDGFRFILYELFIYCVALFLAAEKFDILELLLQKEYYISSRSADGLDPLTPFTFFQQSVPAFELINQQSNPRLYFPRARRLLDRVPGSGLEPNALMEADFVCALASQARTGAHWWYPDTLIYDGRSNPHPAFARSKSTSYYKKVRQAIGLPSDELKALASRVDNHGELFQHVAYYRFCMARLIGSDNLATTP